MVQVIDIIPFDTVEQLNLLLKKKENKNAEVINHAIVVKKWVRYKYDDRI